MKLTFISLYETIISKLVVCEDQVKIIELIDLLLSTGVVKEHINDIVTSDFIYLIPTLFRPLMDLRSYYGLFKLIIILTEDCIL